VQNPWRRAGALYGTVGRLVVMTVGAALLVAGVTLPFVGVLGIATRDAANTFNDLQVGALGQVPTYSTLYDIEGRPIATFYPGDIYRQPVTYSQIAPVMRNAIVAIEDNTFYQQGALDPRGTLRALFSDSSGGELQGASTLAQQYVKNVKVLQAGHNAAAAAAAAYPSLQRKIVQLRIAAEVEHEMTQNQLLAAYLNVAYFSEEAYGIQVAAERYFSVPASRLTLTEAALLAGIVQSPTEYNPLLHPDAAIGRRNEVIGRMAQLNYISQAEASATEKLPLGLNMSTTPLQTGCESSQTSTVDSAFFCDYVQHVLMINYPSLWSEINNTGGLSIYTTLNMRDQIAADNAVNYVEPQHNDAYNPGDNADTEVLIQPGTGAVRAIAINRRFGTGPGEDDIDYAVNSNYGGGAGVQTGSSSKIFTLITALKQGVPFGHPIKVVSPSVVGPYYNCQQQLAGGGNGAPIGYFNVVNAEGDTPAGGEIYELYSATVGSINVYFAHLEQQVGLCNVVRTAVDMGMTRADGTSLLSYDKGLAASGSTPYSADNIPSFTLGAVNVSPMSMAAAYASVAARGWYCAPNVLVKIVVTGTGASLPVQPVSCHRDMSEAVADAANYILQGVLETGTAAGRGIGRPAAAKTGTANGGYYAAFAGYTPTLTGYVSVFNPIDPTTGGAMLGANSCYRDVGNDYPSCPGQMYGDNAPGATWEETFLNAPLGPPVGFVPVPPGSIFWSLGNGQVEKAVSPPRHGGPGHGPGPGPLPSPLPPGRHH
jgi:membrane peptidoglycan carboxypeptidase